eukprot:8398528-Pyramimonas_sp.AAC.1
MARIGRAIAQPSIGPAILYGAQVIGASRSIARSMTKMVRVGWHKTPMGTSPWLASQLEQGRDQRPDIFAVAEP